MNMRFGVLLLLLLLPVAAEPQIKQFTPGQPHKYVDENGVTHFTDRPTHDGYVKLVKTWKGWQTPLRRADYQANVRAFTPIVEQVSRQHQVSPRLVHAVVYVESYYDPNAVSTAGAMGLMQLMPATAERYGVRNRRDPHKNIQAGVKYLRDLLDLFKGDLELVLAAYNAGENAVMRYGNKVPPYAETREYVRRVKNRLVQLNR